MYEVDWVFREGFGIYEGLCEVLFGFWEVFGGVGYSVGGYCVVVCGD